AQGNLRLRERKGRSLPRHGPGERSALATMQCLIPPDALEKLDPFTERGESIGGQAAAMDSIAVERFVDDAGRGAAVNQADCALPVRAGPHRLVEAANANERGAAHGRSRTETTVKDCRGLIGDIERARRLEAAGRPAVD